MALSVELSKSLCDYVGEELYRSRGCSGIDTNIFFPEFDNNLSRLEKKKVIDQAVRICMNCPIRKECLDWALSRGQRIGIWGGEYLEDYYKRSRRYRN